MTFLIDGYNLMYAEGYLARKMPAKKYELQRGRFLDWLAASVAGRGADVLVIFDAKYAVGPSKESTHRGIRVRFAYRQLADDLIEALVRAEVKPAAVTVVSNDRQVRDAARRGSVATFTSDEFADWLATRREAPATPALPAEKPDAPAPGEHDELLKAFSVPRPKRRGK